MEENKPYAYSNIKMEENKTYAYSSQICMKCNSVFVYHDGWHCNCETTESLQKIIKDTLDELPESYAVDYTPENLPENVRYWIQNYAEEREKRVELETIINDTLRALPVGNINTHTPESIPERVQDWVKEAAEECYFREKWEEIADNLIPYAEDFARYLEEGIYKNNPFSNHRNYQAVSKVIEQYEKLKNYEY